MMATVRSRIIAAVVEQIGDLGRAVYTHLDDALATEELPVLLVGWNSESVSALGMHQVRKLDVSVQAIASGKNAETDADDLIGEAYARILAAPRSLGGLVKQITPTESRRESTEQAQVVVTEIFTIEYMTLDNSLSTQP